MRAGVVHSSEGAWGTAKVPARLAKVRERGCDPPKCPEGKAVVSNPGLRRGEVGEGLANVATKEAVVANLGPGLYATPNAPTDGAPGRAVVSDLGSWEV